MTNDSATGGEQCLRLRWTLAVRDDPRVPSLDKHLALTLSTFMDEGGYCWPGVSKIAEAMGVDARTVQRHLHGDPRTRTEAWLRDLGYLRIERGGGQSRARPGGARSRTHGFRAMLPKLAETPAACRPYPGTLTPKGGTVTENPGSLPPELSKEPVSKPVSSGRLADDISSSPQGFDEDAEAALADLISEIGDADRNTEQTFRRHFGDLSAEDFDDAAEVLGKRRNGTRLVDEAIESEAGFVFSVLANFKSQRLVEEEVTPA